MIIRWLFVIMVSLFLMAQPALAQGIKHVGPSPVFNPDLGFSQTLNSLPRSRFDTNIQDLISVVLDVSNTILVVLMLAGLIISGIMYITAGGDEEKAKKARQNMVWIVIGILIYIFAFWVLYATRAVTDCFINSYQLMMVQQFMFALFGVPGPC